MGIDISMKWRGQTEAERKRQYTGYDTTAGGVGYLREAYHGGPYVTRFLVGEAFGAEECEAKISAKTLRERLPAAVMIAIYRNHVVYEQGRDPSFIDLSGKPGDGDVQLLTRVTAALAEGALQARKGESCDMAKRFNAEQIRATEELIKTRNLPEYALSFVDFVGLAERMEKKTGEPVTIYASY